MSAFAVDLTTTSGFLVIGSLLSPRIQRRVSMRTLIVGWLWINVCVGFFIIEPSVYVLLAAALPSVFMTPTVNAVVIGYRAAIVPDRLIGRVTSVARTFAQCASPLGPLLAGVLLGALSARETVGIFVGILAILAVVATTSSAIKTAPSLKELDRLPAPG